MTNKCASRKTPCETSKICNPTSGRCVLKTGKIGMALLKGGNVSKTPVHHATKKPQLTSQMVEAFSRKIHSSSKATSLKPSKKKVSFANEHGKSLTHIREIPARGHLPSDLDFQRAAQGVVKEMKRKGTLENWAQKVSRVQNTSLTTTDLVHAINATSVRKSPTTGKIQAVPKAYVSKATGKVITRGAPAAHAKNHKNQFGTGLDGLQYQSLPKGGGGYRWKKV